MMRESPRMRVATGQLARGSRSEVRQFFFKMFQRHWCTTINLTILKRYVSLSECEHWVIDECVKNWANIKTNTVSKSKKHLHRKGKYQEVQEETNVQNCIVMFMFNFDVTKISLNFVFERWKGGLHALCLWEDLRHPMDYNPSGSSVHGILQTRILAWIAIPFSWGSSWSEERTWVSCITGRFISIHR